MKIAVLVLGHKNPHQIARLINTLADDRIDVYVHIDSKAGFPIDDIKQNIIKTQVYFASKRYNVNAYSMDSVYAILGLINLAKEHGEYQYYYLLSGQDYPIKSIKQLISFLDYSYPKPFIDCIELDAINENWVYYGFAKKTNYFPKYKNWIYNSISVIPNTNLKILLKYLLVGPVKVFELVLPSPYKKLNKQIRMFGGSEWWALSDICIEDIQNWINRYPKQFKCLAHTGSPDESVFQTVLMNTGCSKLVELRTTYGWQNCLTYANFSGIYNEKKSYGSPYILTTADYEGLMSLDKYIARKFDEKVDCEILTLLDKIL
jgi:hypothetical protein